MEPENAIVFWNQNGEPLVTVVGHEITSDKLIDLFDTQSMRDAIKEYGHRVDNTSEEFASVELKT